MTVPTEAQRQTALAALANRWVVDDEHNPNVLYLEGGSYTDEQIAAIVAVWVYQTTGDDPDYLRTVVSHHERIVARMSGEPVVVTVVDTESAASGDA